VGYPVIFAPLMRMHSIMPVFRKRAYTHIPFPHQTHILQVQRVYTRVYPIIRRLHHKLKIPKIKSVLNKSLIIKLIIKPGRLHLISTMAISMGVSGTHLHLQLLSSIEKWPMKARM
jgi:hypothetical protein